MLKRLIALFLTLLLIVQTCPALMERAVPTLTDAEITALKQLAGGADDSAQWHEGMAPSASMSAWQMYEWADWFLSETLHSLMLSAQSYTEHWDDKTNLTKEQQTIVDIEWKLHDLEDELSYHEEILENGRLAILNGIETYQSEDAADSDKICAYDRIMEAKSEIEASIATISSGYAAYKSKLNAYLNQFTAVQSNADFASEEDAHTAQVQDEAEEIERKENATNAGFDVTVLSTNQIAIVVQDANQNRLQGVQIQLIQESPALTQTKSTDARGRAIFNINEFSADEDKKLKLILRIRINGYQEREIKYLNIKGGEAVTFHLDERNAAEAPYLYMGSFNDKDILSETHTFYYSQKNDADHTFSFKVKSQKAGTLTLCYQTYDGNDIVEKNISQSYDADDDEKEYRFKGKWLKTLVPDGKITIKLTENGKDYNFPCTLNIEKALVSEPYLDNSALFSFTGGSSGLQFKLPDSMPFVGGSTLSLLDLQGNFPSFVIMPSGWGMFSWGYDYAYERKDWKNQEKAEQDEAMRKQEKKSDMDAVLARLGVYKNVNTSRSVKTLYGASAHVTPFVGLQGLYRASDQVFELRGNAGVTMAFKAGFTQTFTMGPVPFFAGVDFTMGMSFGTAVTMSMHMNIEKGKLPSVKDGPDIDFNGLTVSVRLELGATFGIGLKNICCVSFRGYGYINPIIHFTNPVRAEAKIGMGFSATVKILFIKYHWVIWEGNMPLNSASNGEVESIVLDSTGSSEPIIAVGGAENGGVNTLSPVTLETLFSRIDCATADLQFITLGDTSYVFWIDQGSERKPTYHVTWYNLQDLSKHGEVTWLDADKSIRKNKSYHDYAFAVDVVASTGGSDFCALTILSGDFSKYIEEPTASCQATVLLQKQKDGTLSMVYYREQDDTDVSSLGHGGYMTMPEVFINAGGDVIQSVFIISTFVPSNSPNRVMGVMVSWDFDTKALIPITIGSDVLHESRTIGAYAIGRPRGKRATDPELYKVNIYALRSEDTRCLSRLRLYPDREEIVKQNVVNFRVLARTEEKFRDHYDFLFYLESEEKEEGQVVNKLKSALIDQESLTLQATYTDYDIEVVADTFDMVQFGGALYIYWVECSAPPEDDSGEYKESYLIKCVRYDMATNTVCDPFALVELDERPANVKLQTDGTGYYTVDTEQAEGSYTSYALKKFTYRLIMAAEIDGAAPNDSCVCAGDYLKVVFSVTNTGNLPLMSFDIAVRNKDTLVQTVHVDCTAPDNNTNAFYTAYGTNTQTGSYNVRRISSIYDDVNGDSWDVTETDANGVTTEKSVRTKMLMPGDTHAYTASLLIPADWSGDKSLTAEVDKVVAATQYGALLTVNGLTVTNDVPQTVTGTRGENADEASSDADDVLCRLVGSETLNTDRHDLVLTAQPYDLDGETYVRVNITNRSGNAVSDAVPTFTVTNGDEVLFSYTFVESLGDGYGYTFDVPVETLTGGRKTDEIELNIFSASNGFAEDAELNNHVRLTLDKPLTISEQPTGLQLLENDTAVFSVTAEGGTTPYAYRWQQYNAATSRWLDISGTTGRTYTLTRVRQSQSGLTVRCVVTDAEGDSVNSDPATLTVTAVPSTGDTSTPALWLLMMLVPAAVLGVYLVIRKRKE